MANNISTTTSSPSAYPNATPIATQQLADGSHASVAVITDPTNRAKQLLITAAGEATVNLADGASVTQGAKADAAWDGAAASPTLVAIWKFCAAKIEAVRAALVTDGANATVGAKADAAWDGAAASPTIVAIKKYMSVKLEAIRAALVTDGANATVGAKADAAWDGAAASPTLVAVHKYSATKVEAVRAALVTDGANVTLGAKADTVWDGSAGTISAMGLFKYIGAKLEAIRAALVDATAVSAVKQVKDTNRVGVVIRVANVRNTSTAETVLTLSITRDGAAYVGGSPTSYSPTSGKRFRMETIVGTLQNPSTQSAAAAVAVRIRQNPSGAAIISSVEHEMFSIPGVSAANGFSTPVIIPITEGREIPDGAGICVTGIVPTWVTNTADPGFQISIIGYEYTP